MIPTITFIALYRGKTVGDAILIATSIEPELVGYVAEQVLAYSTSNKDSVLNAIGSGKEQALRLIVEENSSPKAGSQLKESQEDDS